MSDLMRQVIDSILPQGSAWRVAPGSDLDKQFNGQAANWETVRDFLSCLSCVRSPADTTFLGDLEREYGVITNESLTDAQRRAQLTPVVYSRDKGGSIDELQAALDAAGFTVQVHSNDPAVDPAIFLVQAFQMVAGGATAYAGNQEAYASNLGGELLVNGDIYKTRPLYTSVAGTFYAATATAGEYDTLDRIPIQYPIPDTGWPMVFFVGGDATRDGVTGELLTIDLAYIPEEQETEFKRIILKYKPIHTWAGLIVTYV